MPSRAAQYSDAVLARKEGILGQTQLVERFEDVRAAREAEAAPKRAALAEEIRAAAARRLPIVGSLADDVDHDPETARQVYAATFGREPPISPAELLTEQDTLRPIAALDFADPKPADPPTGAPLVEWMAPADLLVDAAYQRDLSEKSLKLIRRIVEHFDWRRFKPPIVAWTERGFEIIDGQHTAIAAATHPGIDKIPVLVVEAAELQARASAFIGHNRDRLAVNALQLHHAAVAAGDPEAVIVEQVCARAGVTLLHNVYGSRTYKPGETLAVGGLVQLVARRGALRARELLEVLVQAECSPITAHGMKAVELLLTDQQYADDIEPADLVAAIKATAETADKEAKVWASEHCLPFWRGLVATWFRKCKKRRKA